MAGKWRKVRTQTELDKVLSEGDYAEIEGTGWFEQRSGVSASDSASVRAYGSASVSAYCDPQRFVAVKVKVSELVPIGEAGASDKCKAPRCTVLYECDEDGVRIESQETAPKKGGRRVA